MDHELRILAVNMRGCQHRSASGRKRMRFVRTLIATFALAAITASVEGQEWPTKPVRIVTGGSGGFNDIVSRHFASLLSARWGQPVFVENRAGAGLTIGTAVAAQSAPDGYT